MRKTIVRLLGLSGLLFLALPQTASAQNFSATFQYSAKYLCGTLGLEAGLGVVPGHYNTTINVRSNKNKTFLAYIGTATKNSYFSEGTVSAFSSPRISLDRDGAIGIDCRDIKRGLFDISGEGFIEGFVSIYSNGALDVTDVLTGEQCNANNCDTGRGLTAMQVYEVKERPVTVTFKPSPAP